jgi:hypothetical protein
MTIHEQLSFAPGATDPAAPKKFWTANPSMGIVTSTPTLGRPRRINTQARVQSAIKAAQNAGLVVKRVTITADGSITIVSQEEAQGDAASPDKAASWDDA